jgi:hypothetical protein
MTNDRELCLFRVWNNTGDVFALFPLITADVGGRITAYQHVGQHAAADYVHCMHHSSPATPEEYAPLKTELESIGYTLDIKE